MHYSSRARRAHRKAMESMQRMERLFTCIVLIPLSVYAYLRLWTYLLSL